MAFHWRRQNRGYVQRTSGNSVLIISQALDFAASKATADADPAERVPRRVFISGLRDFARNPRRVPGAAVSAIWLRWPVTLGFDLG